MFIFVLLLMVAQGAKLGSTLQERMAADEPLEGPVEECKNEEPNLRVPNVVHYIWFGCKRKFLPYHYLSVLSALSVQKACQVFFHTDCEPPADNLLFQHLKETGVLYRIIPDLNNNFRIFFFVEKLTLAFDIRFAWFRTWFSCPVSQ